eukprot:10115506-Ditylum_brightwellii.AAC.1
MVSHKTVGLYIRDLQLHIQVTYQTQLDESHKLEDYIKDGCADVVAAAIERVSSTLRNKMQGIPKLCGCHGMRHLTPIPSDIPNQMKCKKLQQNLIGSMPKNY